MTQQNKYNLFTLGVVLTTATEIVLHDSDMIHHTRLKQESKHALSNLLKSVQAVRFWAGRMNEVVVGRDEESMEVFDNLNYNANRFIQLLMMYCDITNGANKNMETDAETMFNTLLNLSLKAGGQPFSQELINSYEPRV